MLRYSKGVEWLNPQQHISKLAVDVTSKSLRVREVVQGAGRSDSWEFPGMQPVSMTLMNVQMLMTDDYVVAFKADGIRVFMTLLPNDRNVYLTGRDMKTYRLRSVNRNLLFKKGFSHRLLYQLDGELVCYRCTGSSNNICFMYIPHDILTYRGQCVEPLAFHYRRNCIDALIREDELCNDSNKPSASNFVIFKKSFLNLDYLQCMNSGGALPSDGFIFQSLSTPYVRGTCSMLLKWKPPQQNSIDFRLYVQRTDTPGIIRFSYTCAEGTEVHSEFVNVKNADMEQRCLSLNGKIIEFIKQADGRCLWYGIRRRDDKLQPNSIATYNRVLQSISDSVSWQELLLYCTK